MVEGTFTRGVYAPVAEERELTDLPVTGTLPPELDGLLIRNGPNPNPASARGGGSEENGWFLGNGMLHGIRIRDGKAQWYRNRYVKTGYLTGQDPPPDHDSPANTHVIGYNGQILALCEGGWPYAVTPELETIGMVGFNNQLKGAMTAHPKLDPVTGEMVLFGYDWQEPYLRYHVADSAGELKHSVDIDVKGPTMMHDFATTASRTLFLDLPVVFDLERAMQGVAIPYNWDDEYGARVGILPRYGNSSDVRWFEIDPCYIFHVFNAYDEGDEVVLDASRYDKIWVYNKDTKQMLNPANSYLVRYRFNLATGTSSMTTLSDTGVEFPRVDLNRVGLAYRYGYGAVVPDDNLNTFSSIAKFDLQANTTEVFDTGADCVPGEPIFVGAAGQSAEDHGYLITVNYNKSNDRSDILVIDAGSMSETIAKIELPFRIPMGFHGSWLPWETVGSAK
ncbi:MAG: carotenoid oxygenase family protein [Candidatus Nanopelagicales bacterium]|nr:carotenoid oxygenase family protein [Candidatus Nanopelagicales bacterium]